MPFENIICLSIYTNSILFTIMLLTWGIEAIYFMYVGKKEYNRNKYIDT